MSDYIKGTSPKQGLKSKLASLLPLLWGSVGLIFIGARAVSGLFNPLYDTIMLLASVGFFIGSVGVIMEKIWGYIVLVTTLSVHAFIAMLNYQVSFVFIDLVIIGAVSKSYLGYSPVG